VLLERAQERGPFVLAGHSFGGLAALNYAVRYPDEVAGMGASLKYPPWSAAERHAWTARTVVHLIVGPAATASSSCRYPAALGCGRVSAVLLHLRCLLRGRGGDTAGRERAA